MVLAVEVVQGGLDGGYHEGGEGAVLALDGGLHLLDHGVGEADGLHAGGRDLWDSESHNITFCNTFCKTIVLQNPELHCIINRLHFVLCFTGDDVMRETTAKEPEERPADYREMYLVMARAMEKCVRELVEAQRRCEELYLRPTEE